MKLVTLFILMSLGLNAQWITGHYAAQNGTMPVSAIPWNKYTHIVHFAAAPNADGTVKMHYLTQAEINSMIAARPAGKKVIVCIKDNDADSSAFTKSTSPAVIAKFVTSIVNFVTSNNYDGVDLDWENTVNTTQYIDLLARLHSAMPSKLVTIDSGNWNGLETVAGASYANLDQINLMCYDMDAAGNGFSWHNDALLQNGNSGVSTCDWRVRAFTQAGVPASKIGIGIPYYGRRWTGTAMPLVSGAFAPSTVLYRDLVRDTVRWQSQYQRYDSGYKANYLSLPALNEFISYNGTESVTDAAAWQKSAGLGGFMTFTLDYEYLSNQTGDASHPLSTALYSAVFGSTPIPGPVISAGTPSGTLGALTSTVTLSVNTNVNATCRYSTVSGTAYNAMPSIFAITGATTHLMPLVGLLSGSRTYYVRCADLAGNADTADYPIAFSIAAQIPAPSLSYVSPAAGSGSSQVFSFNVSDGSGSAAIQQIDAVFDSATGKTNSCVVEFWAPTKTIFLKADNDAAWTSGALGTGATLQNSQCSLNPAASTVSGAGNTLTLALSMNFTTTYAGDKSILFYAANQSGLNTGWQTLGNWTVPAPPPVPALTMQVTPGTGAGAGATFTMNLTDTTGYASVQQADLFFGTTFGAAGSCLIDVWVPTKTVSLRNDANTGWAAQGQIGSSAVLQNSQCSVSLGAATVSGSGNTLKVSLPVSFKVVAFRGSRQIYYFGADQAGKTSGWQTPGSWVITPR